MSTINPDDYIITRKRKKYRFAKFALSPLCFEYDQWLENRRAVDVIEIGAGTGLFSVELATHHPEKTYLALDVKGDRLQKGAYEAQARGLKNIWFLRARADQLPDIISPKSVESIWLTFPDPFPKKGSAGRRLTHSRFLDSYAEILEPRGKLHFKHDNPEFFRWSLEQLVATGWRIDELSFDLYESELSGDYKIMTTYEQRWLEQGRFTQFVSATPPVVAR